MTRWREDSRDKSLAAASHEIAFGRTRKIRRAPFRRS